MEKVKKCFNNLLNNFVFVVSCFAFIFMSSNAITLTWKKFLVSPIMIITVATIMAIIFAMKHENLLADIKKSSKMNLTISSLATFGVIEFYIKMIYDKIPFEIYDTSILINPVGFNKIIFCVLISILAIPFCMVLFSKIYKYLGNAFSKLYGDMTKKEKTVIIVSFVLLLILLLISFIRSDVFYNSEIYGYDKIYSSDTMALLKQNAWMNISHMENDVRQPLFGVFALPFVAPINAITFWFGDSGSIIYALSVAIADLILIIAIAYMLSSFVEKGNKRLIFLIFYLSMFSTLLFTIMMEQYVVALFWLILFIYMYINNMENREVAFIGATGSLLTSGILFWLIPDRKDSWKIKIKKIFRTAVLTFFIMFLFGRVDVLLTLKVKLDDLLGMFSGSGDAVPILDRINQYTHFLANSFVGINGQDKLGAWVQSKVYSINLAGIGILILSVISFIKNRKNKINVISFVWVVYSIIIIVGIGWGTKLNELMLYSLYFGWAFAILIYNLLKDIFIEINKEKYFYIFIAVLAALMMILNLFFIDDMVSYLQYVSEVVRSEHM